MIFVLNEPTPLPSIIFVDKLTVGFGFTDQTIPRSVTLAPQSVVISPPVFTVVVVISVIGLVLTFGTNAPDQVGFPFSSTV